MKFICTHEVPVGNELQSYKTLSAEALNEKHFFFFKFSVFKFMEALECHF